MERLVLDRRMDNFFNITTAHCVVMAAVNLKEYREVIVCADSLLYVVS